MIKLCIDGTDDQISTMLLVSSYILKCLESKTPKTISVDIDGNGFSSLNIVVEEGRNKTDLKESEIFNQMDVENDKYKFYINNR